MHTHWSWRWLHQWREGVFVGDDAVCLHVSFRPISTHSRFLCTCILVLPSHPFPIISSLSYLLYSHVSCFYFFLSVLLLSSSPIFFLMIATLLTLSPLSPPVPSPFHPPLLGWSEFVIRQWSRLSPFPSFSHLFSHFSPFLSPLSPSERCHSATDHIRSEAVSEPSDG